MVKAKIPHGIVQVLGEALSDLVLTPEQEAAVEPLGAQIEPLQSKIDDAETELLRKLAEQAKACSADSAALEPSVAAYATARANMAPVLRSAVESLHGVLTPEQRVDFAEALQSRIYGITRAAMSSDNLDEFATQMNLTKEQDEAIRAIVKELKQGLMTERENLHQTVEAFRGDSFAVEQFLPLSEVSAKARARAQSIVDATFAILRVLGPAQRDKLAARINDAVSARAEDEPEEPETTNPVAAPLTAVGAESVSTAAQRLWAAGRVRRGPYGGVRGGVVIGGAGRYAYGRAVRYPVVAGWGYGW